jgi:hypothetical protein
MGENNLARNKHSRRRGIVGIGVQALPGCPRSPQSFPARPSAISQVMPSLDFGARWAKNCVREQLVKENLNIQRETASGLSGSLKPDRGRPRNLGDLPGEKPALNLHPGRTCRKFLKKPLSLRAVFFRRETPTPQPQIPPHPYIYFY